MARRSKKQWVLEATVAPAFPRDAFARGDRRAVDLAWTALLEHSTNAIAKGFSEGGISPTASANMEIAATLSGAVKALREWQQEVNSFQNDRLDGLGRRIGKLEAKIRQLEKGARGG